jgi:hypothetical protein
MFQWVSEQAGNFMSSFVMSVQEREILRWSQALLQPMIIEAR